MPPAFSLCFHQLITTPHPLLTTSPPITLPLNFNPVNHNEMPSFTHHAYYQLTLQSSRIPASPSTHAPLLPNPGIPLNHRHSHIINFSYFSTRRHLTTIPFLTLQSPGRRHLKTIPFPTQQSPGWLLAHTIKHEMFFLWEMLHNVQQQLINMGEVMIQTLVF